MRENNRTDLQVIRRHKKVFLCELNFIKIRQDHILVTHVTLNIQLFQTFFSADIQYIKKMSTKP